MKHKQTPKPIILIYVEKQTLILEQQRKIEIVNLNILNVISSITNNEHKRTIEMQVAMRWLLA